MSGDFKSFFNGADFFAIETVEIKKIPVRPLQGLRTFKFHKVKGGYLNVE